jgi:arylsulfatase
MNVVLIFCDDLGYGDLGCYGGSIRTSHIDSLASGGMRFTQWLSANPVCSPSRAALMTGRYPTRVSVPDVLFPYSKTGLPDTEMTIAQMLKARDYRTCCVGKWHLGHLPPYLPVKRGFDEYFGIPYSNDMNPPVLMDNTEVIEQNATQDTLTQRYTERAVSFIDKAKDKPFFLYMPHTFRHIPLYANERFRGKSPHGIYGDVISEIDWSVGEVLGSLKKHGLERNTLVLFSSDNGPWFQGSPGRLRGRKGMTWEGGVRVPFLAKLPGRIPAGRVSQAVGSAMDVLPTVSKLCDVPLPKNPVDGIDMWPALSGAKQEVEREALLYFDSWNLQCARLGKWKLHLARHNSVAYAPAPAAGRKSMLLQKPELYDVISDPDESYDVAGQHPDIVRDIQTRSDRLLAGFPREAQDAWAQSRALSNQETRAGAVTR